ncbi:hypothetical protein [Xanthomonas nasturtii]|uniref:hypothetical protein n=1 Tax=Xanthomonas nasturtii TaxID=1843581 RepID=UPI002012BFC9|nr:hypothetical protein [Xanthomonas nasturtii]MCL1535973.1 hypothetical protein [Xanthomonas nasturtii]MCL1544793.1 hypothetical protein [Xanthomonas nasturtii]MCL1572382.1 hypothetical protein [Xanthomonas nasturtii]MCL1581025.1 hypothetical protein [Xanthomonas nasturtii]
MDVLAACPAMVGWQGPCSKRKDVECAVLSPLVGHAVNPSMGLGGGIHAANGPAIGEDTAPDSWLVVL